MVSKCANPRCSREFKYMHEGKVFQLGLYRAALTTDLYEDRFAPELEPHPRVELFWLCDDCSQMFTLVVHGGNMVTLEPMEDYEPLARAC